MFTHIFLGAKDIEASRKFYDATLGALGHAPGAGGGNRYVYLSLIHISEPTRPY